MPPHKSIQSIHTTQNSPYDLQSLAQRHGGNLPNRYSRFQPYVVHTHPSRNTIPESHFTLPQILLDKIRTTQDAAVSHSTHIKDASRLREFFSFCKGLGINDSDILPAKEELLMAWAASYAGRLAGKTVAAKILAIRKEHEKRGFIWQGGPLLRQLLKGIEEIRPTKSFRDKRAPVTIQILEDLNKGLSRTSGLDICIRAIALLSFFCQLRIGEILPPKQDINEFNAHRYATFSNIAESTAENGACNLHLPWSKTQKARGDDVWIPRQEAPLDPIHAIHKHFIKNKLRRSHPIAAYRDENNNIVTLTRSKFIHRINSILRKARKDHPRITGHCFRIGGTTFYLVSGVPPDMVKKFGRWRSQAFLEYWRCLDYLGAIHINMLPLKPGLQRSSRSYPRA
jgi:hypothetical protein